jgi:hypothetical protein
MGIHPQLPRQTPREWGRRKCPEEMESETSERATAGGPVTAVPVSRSFRPPSLPPPGVLDGLLLAISASRKTSRA